MSTLSALVDRIKRGLRDPLLDNEQPQWQRSEVVVQLDESLTRLGRLGVMGNVAIIQAVQGHTLYPLNAQGSFLATGVDNSGGTDTLLTVTDTTADFVTAGVAVDDRVKNLTDGSAGMVTTVAATVLTCADGFQGGVNNSVDTGDRYLVERPLTANVVVSIDAVLYNGEDLHFATEELLDRRQGPGWETLWRSPRYWTTEATPDGTVLRIIAAPLRTGSSTLVLPPVPFPMPWQDNLLVFYREQPQQTLAEEAMLAMTDVFEDLLIYDTMATLSADEGDVQDLAVAVVYRSMAQLWMTHLGLEIRRG